MKTELACWVVSCGMLTCHEIMLLYFLDLYRTSRKKDFSCYVLVYAVFISLFLAEPSTTVVSRIMFTVRGYGGSRVGEVRAGTTSPMP